MINGRMRENDKWENERERAMNERRTKRTKRIKRTKRTKRTKKTKKLKVPGEEPKGFEKPEGPI